jgi:hypothetical protein
MSSVQTIPSLLDELLDFLVDGPTPEQMIALRPSEAVQQRVSDLLEKNRSSGLTPDENAELDEYLRLDQFVTLLKARVHEKLRQLE